MVQHCLRPWVWPLLGSALLVSGLLYPAFGQEIVMFQADASPCAIFRALSPRVPPQCQRSYRGVVIHETNRPAAPERSYLFATRIAFALDSSQLTTEAQQFLHTVATVLQDPLMADTVVRLEGHTDSTGSAAYNRILSRKRALAVQRYLRVRYGIAERRLPTVGKGADEPYDPHNPRAATNRRVQFVNVSVQGG